MEMPKKQRKHRRKESFSVLLISNTGQNAKQFHITKSFARLFGVFVLCACVAFGWLVYQYLFADEIVSSHVNASEGSREMELLDQIVEQEELMKRLEEENETLSRRNDELVSENKALLAVAKTTMEASAADAENSGENVDDDPSFPSLYPYSETGEVSVKYSEDHPYVSIDTQTAGDVVATGDGTIAAIGSDDTYPLIIEIEHGNGYMTRYMFPQSAEPLLEAGEQVQAGTVLVSVDIQNEELDYQVIYDEEPIDPMDVFEAKG